MSTCLSRLLRIFDLQSIHNSNQPQFSVKHNDLDEALIYLCQWGRPKLVRTAKGWYCFLDVGEVKHGTLLSIGSEIHHANPSAAVFECVERATDFLNENPTLSLIQNKNNMHSHK